MRAPSFAKLAFVVAATFGSCVGANGQWVVGRYAGEFMSLGAGARALAMGGASVAAPIPATAAYYNPAALAGLTKRHVEFMHASQFDNLFTYDYLSLASPLPGGHSASLALLYARVGDIPITRLADPNAPLTDNNRVLVDRETGDHELALVAATGRNVGRGWKAGATAKLLYKTVADESAYGLGFDLGFGRTVARSLDVGLNVRDVTTSILGWSTGRTEAILPSVLAGGAWSAELKRLNAQVSLVADVETHFESRGESELASAGVISAEPHIGAEYLISRTVALRGGMSGKRPTLGAGLRLSWLTVNAAFQDHQDLGLTHRISVGATW